MVSPSKIQHQKQKALPKDTKVQRQSHIRLQRGDKPLERKKFYLDIKNHALASKLETKIKDFGGNIELFLDQSVTFIVSDRTDKFEPANSEKQKWGYTSGGSVGPPSLRSVEVPTSTWTPPTPSLNGECPLSNSTNTRGQTTQRTKSRVDAMLERALTQPQQCSVDPLENAHNWGIPIWTTDKLQAWLDKIYASLKDSNNTLKNVNRSDIEKNLKFKDFTKSYIKFESFNRNTRPVFLELPVWPKLNFDGEPGSCPFDKKARDNKEDIKKSETLNKDKKKEMTRKPRANTTRAKRSEQLVAGYCEICRCEYKDLTKHVQSDKHLAFVRNGDNFLSLDTLINAGANVEAFLKLNRSDDVGQDLFPNGNDSLHSMVILNDKDSSTKPNLTDFNVDELKMVQCNGARRKLNLKLSSPHNLRTRAKHESGHLLRSKGSPWHEVDKSEKFYEKFEKYTIKKRAKGTIWIEEDDPQDKCTDDEDVKDIKTSQIVEKIPLMELNDVGLKNKDSHEHSTKKNRQLPRMDDRRDRKKNNINRTNEEKRTIENTNVDIATEEFAVDEKSNCNVRLTPNKEGIVLNRDPQPNGALKSPVTTNGQVSDDHIEVTVKPNDIDEKNRTDATGLNDDVVKEKLDDEGQTVIQKPTVDEKKDDKTRPCRMVKRNVRSFRARQRLSVEERLIEDNRAYYKVEVLGNKLRSSATHVSNSHVSPVREAQKEVKEVKIVDGPSSEKPVVVRFKRVRKSELSLLSDEAESFMFGDSRRDDSSSSSDWNGQRSSSDISVLPKDTESESNGKDSPSIITSPTIDGSLDNTRLIKQEPIDEESEDSSYVGRARKRRRTQAEALIMDNADYYKFEMPGSRLRFQTPSMDVKDGKQIHEVNLSDMTTATTTLMPRVPECSGSDSMSESLQNTEEKLYPSKPSAEVEKMRFSFESIPKSEPWYQTYQRQDTGAEFWHYFSESDMRKPFLLPYEIENFHENLAKIFQKNEAKKKVARLPGPNGLGRSPRKSPRCHASTLAIMSTIIRKREQQQQQQQQQQKKQPQPQQQLHQQSLNNGIIEENSRSRANTPNIGGNKSSTDNELREIVKSIDDMLNGDETFEESFDRETLDLIEEEEEGKRVIAAIAAASESHSPGPTSDLIDLLDNCHQYNGFDNSSCASSECGEAITESPLKRRKRRKNRTGWPGIKIRRKLQNKQVIIPDVTSERENLPDKNRNNEGGEKEDEDEEDEEEEEEEEEAADAETGAEIEQNEDEGGRVEAAGKEEEEGKDEETKNEVTEHKRKLEKKEEMDSAISKRNHLLIRERLQVPSVIEPSITSHELRISRCKTTDFIECQLSGESERRSYHTDDTPSRKCHGNDENHENVLFRQDGRVTCSRQHIISKSITRRRQRDIDSRPSSSVTVDTHSSIDNHANSLFRQKSTSGIISRKNYSTGTSIVERRQLDMNGRDNETVESNDTELTTITTTPLITAQHRESTSCKRNDCVIPRKLQQPRTKKRTRKSTSEMSFDDENCRKEQNESSTDVGCAMSERVNPATVDTTQIQQRRSSIEFQPVVRVMKIEDQVEMDHGILSVTVASNRRLRSSTSPKLNSSPPPKRHKRNKGSFGRWIKNS